MRLAALVLLAGCEWIADIPRPSQVGPDVDASTDPDAPGGECATSPECPADRPVCAETACRVCVDDSECGSGVCALDGTCADPARILHASEAGGGDCSAASPCTFDAAFGMVTADRDIIKLGAGTYPRAAALQIPGTVFIAGQGATMTGPGGVVQLFEVTPTGNLTVTGLAMNVNGGYVAACSTAGGTMRFHRTRMFNGLLATFATGCTTEVVRSYVDSFTAYGVYVNGGSARIENTIISRVGTTASTLAALLLLENPTATIDHVTIANNTNDGSGASGVQCGNSPGLAITSSIIRNNSGLSLDPTCVASYSVLDPGYTGAGMPNTVADPVFVDPAAGDFHLMPTSSVLGTSDPAAALPFDIDGQARVVPNDPGADEIP